MTASELYEIVKDVPREAWPEQMMFHARRQMFTNEIEPSPRWDLTEDWAEAAFIGSMTEWLIDQDNSVKSWSPMGEFDGERFRPASFVVALNEDDLDEAKPHHSLVAALAAACKEAA